MPHACTDLQRGRAAHMPTPANAIELACDEADDAYDAFRPPGVAKNLLFRRAIDFDRDWKTAITYGRTRAPLRTPSRALH